MTGTLFVPLHRTLEYTDSENGTTPGAQVHPNPMYGAVLSSNFTVAMAAPAIGAARGFIRAFGQRLQNKLSADDRDSSKGPYADTGLGSNMSRYAHSVAQVDAVHALLLHNAARFSGVPAAKVSSQEAATIRLDQAFAAQQARQAVNTLYEECGGTGLQEKSEFQQIWRDANAAAAHRALIWDWQAELWAQAQLGSSLP
jgi:hypothetical protein